MSRPSFSISSAKNKFYVHFCKRFLQSKVLVSMNPTALGQTDSSKAFPWPGISTAGWHQNSHTRSPPYPWKLGQYQLLSSTRIGERIRWNQEQFIRVINHRQILCSSGWQATWLPFFSLYFGGNSSSASLMIKFLRPHIFFPFYCKAEG